MKTKIEIIVETADSLPVLFEEGDNEATYTEAKKLELKIFQKKFARDFHKYLVNFIKSENFEEHFLDYADEYSIEGWEDLKDYGTTVKIKELKQ
jgi:hypothetical protein